MRNLYIDFDGVILDTIEILYAMLEKANIDRKNFKETNSFIASVDWHNILKTTPEINESFKCIKKLIKTNKFNINILTHISSLNEGIEKIKFIRQTFKDITIILVPKIISKTQMVHTKGEILVDDYVGNLDEWAKEGGISILFSKALKDKGYPVINKLDQIIDILGD